MAVRQAGCRVPDVVNEKPRLLAVALRSIAQHSSIGYERSMDRNKWPVVLQRREPIPCDVLRGLRLDGKDQHQNREETRPLAFHFHFKSRRQPALVAAWRLVIRQCNIALERSIKVVGRTRPDHIQTLRQAGRAQSSRVETRGSPG